MGYSPQGCKESDTTERLHFTSLHFTSRTQWASLVTQMVKSLPSVQETQVHSLGGEDPWRRVWQPTLVCLPGKFHGQQGLDGYSPWGHKESDMTKRLIHTKGPNKY